MGDMLLTAAAREKAAAQARDGTVQAKRSGLAPAVAGSAPNVALYLGGSTPSIAVAFTRKRYFLYVGF
jgi:hypothetical protein